MLSLVSPTSARKSGIFSGGTPIFLITSSRVYVFWWSASIIETPSPTICMMSLSAL